MKDRRVCETREIVEIISLTTFQSGENRNQSAYDTFLDDSDEGEETDVGEKDMQSFVRTDHGLLSGE